jgi:hypothetical protein
VEHQLDGGSRRKRQLVRHHTDLGDDLKWPKVLEAELVM